MNQDQDHLRLLSIFHYVVAGLTALVACFPILHLIVGIVLAGSAFVSENEAPGMSLLVGLFFVGFSSIWIIAGWMLAVAIGLAGRNLARQQSYTYCLVVAAIECTFFPFGTVLGVFTILVLLRPTVKTLFEPPVDAAVASVASERS